MALGRPPDGPKNANAHKFVACERSKNAVEFAAVCEPQYAHLDKLSRYIIGKFYTSRIDLRFYKTFVNNFYKTAKRVARIPAKPSPGIFNLCARLQRGLVFDFCGGGYASQH